MKTGNTRLIRLRTNPSGSMKDRAVEYMLLCYQRDGILKKGGTVVEATSGNTGIAISYFAKENGIKNKKVVAIFPDGGDRYIW